MQETWIKALEAVNAGHRYAFATIIDATVKGTPRKAGAKMIVFEDGSIWGTIGGGRNENAAIAECLSAIKTQKPKTVTYNYFGREGESVCGGQMHVFIEPFDVTKRLIVCGAGHIALPLSALAKILGFSVTIIDHRKAFANAKRFPHVDHIIVADYKKALAKQDLNAHTYVAVVTPGNEYDYECLRATVGSKAAYVGIISSQPKKVKFLGRLKKEGIGLSQLKNIHIPMGIDIGSQTPQEIAVSICAQMIAIKNADYIGTDKFSTKH